MSVVAIIPAAGKGKRVGKVIPKQFIKVNGKEVIAHTLDVFQNSKLIDEIVVATSKKYFALVKRIKKKYKLSKLKLIVEGGVERQNSVCNALTSLNLKKKDLVVVHDAARPFLSSEILEKGINTAIRRGNALIAIPARDTLIQSIKNKTAYLNRSEIFYVQTPQIFRYADLLYASQLAKKEKFVGTDESVLINRAGFKLNIVEGSPTNFKITTKDDLQIAAVLLK